MEPENTRPSPETTPWALVFFIVGAGITAAFQVGKAPPALPMLRAELSVSLLLAGWVLSAFYLAGSLMGSATGSLADWLGHRRMILIGLTFLATGSLIGSFAWESALLLFTRFMEGIGYIIIAVAAPGLLFRIVAVRDLRLVFGVWAMFMPIGGALMMLLAPLVIETIGWRWLWRINAVLLFLFIFKLKAVTSGLSVESRSPGFKPGDHFRDFLTVLKSPGPRLMALCFGTFSLMFMSTMGFLPTMLIEVRGFSPSAAAVLSAIALGANAPGNFLGGYLLHRGVPRWLLVGAAGLVMFVCGFGMFMGEYPFPLRYALVLLFFSISGVVPVAAIDGGASTTPSPTLVATSTGVVMQGAQIGLLIGPPAIAAFVTAFGGWSSAGWLIGFFGMVMVVLSLRVRRLEAK